MAWAHEVPKLDNGTSIIPGLACAAGQPRSSLACPKHYAAAFDINRVHATLETSVAMQADGSTSNKR
jgi:hypothetical protein